jgi:anaphase-promoting complex subunit 3
MASLVPLSREAPDEANIHFLLGKCYLRIGRRPEATVAFTSARELNPKLEGAIKSALKGEGEDDEDEDEHV